MRDIFYKRQFLFLLIVTAIGFILRVFYLDKFPLGFHRDEVYLGYNAYSILNTGKDISSNFLPLFLKSFLYTPAGYSYFSIPFIKILGLNVVAVRMASAIFGTLSIPLIYIVAIKSLIFKKTIQIKNAHLIALTTAIFLAITPWHINLSRTASVSTLVLFFILLGLAFLLKWMDKGKNYFLLLSLASFFMTFFFYIASYVFVPLLVAAVVIFYIKEISRKRLKLFVPFFVILLIPIVVVFSSPELSLRINSLNISKSETVDILLTESIHNDGKYNISPYLTRFFHNKPTVISQLFLKNYFDHFNLNFLLSDNIYPLRYKVPNSGLIYSILFFPFIVGVYTIFARKLNSRWVLLSWILMAPIGSSFASDDVPNMQRTLYILPPLLIISAIGFVFFANSLKKRTKYLFVAIFTILLLYQTVFFIHQYFYHMNSLMPWQRQEGYEELVSSINKLNYQKNVITNRESAPTMFLLFYGKVNPTLIQNTIAKSNLKDTDRISFSKYIITEEECPLRIENKKLVGEKNTLYAVSGLCKIDTLPEKVKIHSKIIRSDGSTAFYLASID